MHYVWFYYIFPPNGCIAVISIWPILSTTPMCIQTKSSVANRRIGLHKLPIQPFLPKSEFLSYVISCTRLPSHLRCYSRDMSPNYIIQFEKL